MEYRAVLGFGESKEYLNYLIGVIMSLAASPILFG
jgi:hypothetical protein